MGQKHVGWVLSKSPGASGLGSHFLTYSDPTCQQRGSSALARPYACQIVSCLFSSVGAMTWKTASVTTCSP